MRQERLLSVGTDGGGYINLLCTNKDDLSGRLWVQGVTADHSLSAFGSGSQPRVQTLCRLWVVFGWCVVLLERYLGIVRSRGRYGAWRYLLTNLVSVTVPPEQGLTLLTQLVKLLHPLSRRLTANS